MSTAITSEQPFGAYRLAPWLEIVRGFANTLPDTFYGRRMAALVRELCHRFAGDGPFDVSLFDAQHARLYPRTNHAERLAFAGVGQWAVRERAYLEGRITGSHSDEPFVFVDTAAGFGLYALFVADVAAKLDRAITVLAIEADGPTRERLAFNLGASSASGIRIGESSVDPSREAGTLDAILSANGIERLDALRLDVDADAVETLSTFFATAAEERWPEMIILTCARARRAPAIDVARQHGYTAMRAGRINTILRRAKAASRASDRDV